MRSRTRNYDFAPVCLAFQGSTISFCHWMASARIAANSGRDRIDANNMGSGPAFKRSFSVSPFEKLHDEEGAALQLVDVVDRADMRVLKQRSGARLPLQTLESAGVGHEVLGKKLQGDVAAQAQVLGLVDDAHAAASEPSQDAIVRDCLADHVVRKNDDSGIISSAGSAALPSTASDSAWPEPSSVKPAPSCRSLLGSSPARRRAPPGHRPDAARR